MAHAIILVTDAAPNVAFRSCKVLCYCVCKNYHPILHTYTYIVSIVIFEFPWQFGIGALSCYLFGIAHTLADVSVLCLPPQYEGGTSTSNLALTHIYPVLYTEQ